MTIVPLFKYHIPGFHKLSFPTLVPKILQCDTWYSYTPLQYHVLYTLSGRGVTPRVVSHSPELNVDCLCVVLSVNMLLLD